jgi:biopolymer transport protein ExbB
MDLIFIVALVSISILAVAFIIERGLALRWPKIIPPAVANAVLHYQSSRDLERLRSVCDHYPSPLARLLVFSAAHLDWPRNENLEVLETRARHEAARMERGLVVLEIIVGIAPLLGLTGTIYGLIILFGSMDQATLDSTNRFAQGISLALNATLLGLLVAIVALVGWTYYSKKVENLAIELESLCDEFLRKHYRSEAAEPDEAIALARNR